MVNYRIDEDVKLIGELLNLSQKQFAEKIAVDAITVARWETGNDVGRDFNEMFSVFFYYQFFYCNEI